MDYFQRLTELLARERKADRLSYEAITKQSTAAERRQAGITWYPLAIRDTEIGRGDYLTIEIERTTHHDVVHQFRFGMPVALFSNHQPGSDRIEGVISYLNGNTAKISLRADELPDWSRDGKLGMDLLFDDNSYDEMNAALVQAAARLGKKGDSKLVDILAGDTAPLFSAIPPLPEIKGLNSSQQAAIAQILSAQDLAIVHGPPGTGKTTTLIQAIRIMYQADQQQLLVVAPSNTAVDLLTEKLQEAGMDVLRVGNPARVSEQLMNLTLDARVTAHPRNRDIRNLKKQANEFRNMAQKYKRNFGPAEREQRKALFTEARKIMREVMAIEEYIQEDILGRAQVITATLVGANHYTVKNRSFHTVVIDEAAQALEPATWIPILKGRKLVLAGDHFQLAPTIKSYEAARDGLSKTLLEKSAEKYPQAVTMLETQYRMHEQIMGYPARIFYENRLQAHPTVAKQLLFPTDEPLLFLDTAGCGYEEKKLGTSTANPEEAAFLLKHLHLLVDILRQKYSPGHFPTIGIIAPYKQQIELLFDLVSQTPGWKDIMPVISVNTIDSFQGQERDIIYISLTRSNTDGDTGFLADIRRMNVAMTRARKKLVVIGDSSTLSKIEFFGRFVEYASENEAYKSAWEFVNQ